MDKLSEILRKNPRSYVNIRLYVCLMGCGRSSHRMQFATPKLKEIQNLKSCPLGTFGRRNCTLFRCARVGLFILPYSNCFIQNRLSSWIRIGYVHVEIAQYTIDPLYLLAALDERYEFSFGAAQHNTCLLLDC